MSMTATPYIRVRTIKCEADSVHVTFAGALFVFAGAW